MKLILQVTSIGFLLTFAISACGTGIGNTTEPAAYPEPTIITTGIPTSIPVSLPTQIYTTQNSLLGDHLLEGKTDLQNAAVVDIPLDGVPLWVVSAPFETGAIFVAVLDDGRTQAYKITKSSYEPFEMSPARLPVNMPPLLATSDEGIQLILPPQDASPLTNPIWIEDKLVYIGTSGDLISSGSTSQTRLPIHALPDARILKDENGRLLILTQPTNRYDHGVLGDDLEAAGITLIETEPELRVILNIPVEAPDVIEGISAIWADLNRDGVREIIVTLSNNQSGARLAAFRADGTMLAEGPAIGLGHRWRHQVTAAAFESGSPPLVVSIRTPHIGGVAEFYQLSEGKLEIVREIAGFSAHSIGSRNLDSAIAGDFDNDGMTELLVPDQAHMNLGILSPDGVATALPLDGVLTSNLSATTVNGQLFIAAGVDGNLRIWTP